MGRTACRGIVVGIGLSLLLVTGVRPGPAAGWERMDVKTLQKMTEEQVHEWAVRQLFPYGDALAAAARRHQIPPRLLATCILNELGDYGAADQVQERVGPPYDRGSTGMAQISIDTAIKHRLVDVGPDEVAAELRALSIPGLAPAAAEKIAFERAIWRRLNQPADAIEGAAREISLILTTLSQRPGAWARQFLAGGVIDRARPYDSIRIDPRFGPSHTVYRDPKLLQIAREQALARAVCAAYNSFDILVAVNPGPAYFDTLGAGEPYANARKHGDNAANLFAGLVATREWFGAVAAAPPPAACQWKRVPGFESFESVRMACECNGQISQDVSRCGPRPVVSQPSEIVGLWQHPDGSQVRFTGAGIEYTGSLVKLTALQKQVGFTVGEQTFRLRRVGPDRYEGEIKWRGTGRAPWWVAITLTVAGNGMSPGGWVRLQ